ncbi:MAG: hypothetical protein ACRCWO_03585 [Bosea sp. (in: a-proteobacteria)]
MQFNKLGPDGIQIVKVPQWLAVIIGIVVVALSLTLVVLAASFALILLPILVLASLVYGWWIRRKIRKSGAAWPKPNAGSRNPDIIEGDFIVLEPRRNSGPDDTPQTPPPQR